MTTSSSISPERCIDYPDFRNNLCSIAWIIGAIKQCPPLVINPEVTMRQLEQLFINGEFITAQGSEYFDLYSPATAQSSGEHGANQEDADAAIVAAKAAFDAGRKRQSKSAWRLLGRMRNAMRESEAALHEAIVLEYGAPVSRADWMARYPADVIEQVMCDLEAFAFTTTVGQAQVKMTPLGVAGLITPWNSNAGFICGKLATALAAGCTAVIKQAK
jgi:aldehyde dehydrogenase (NAD+)